MAIHPGSVKNSFGGHLILWAVFLPLISLIFFPMVITKNEINPAEIAMVQKHNVNVTKVTASANETFSSLFITTGIMAKSKEFFSGISSFGKQSTSDFASHWISGVWLLVYKALWRVYVMSSMFLLPLFAICIAAAVDGFAIRSRKKFRFESHNPIKFYTSFHVIVFTVGMFVFLPLVPITLTSNIMAGILALLAIAVWFTTSNFQTGV